MFVVLSIVFCNVAASFFGIESTRQMLKDWMVHPGQAESDSWHPMMAAMNWLQQVHEGTVYQSIFF